MTIRVTGLKAASRRLDGRRMQRVVTPAFRRGARAALRAAKRRNFGFTDRTGRLRRSLRVLTNRSATTGGFVIGIVLEARTRYASYVEHKRRTRDRRPGPPYWLGRIAREFRHRIVSEVRRTSRKL